MLNLHLRKSHEARISEAKLLGLRRLARPTFIMLYGIVQGMAKNFAYQPLGN